MISVTDRAAEVIHEALEQSGLAGNPVRLFISDLVDGQPQFGLSVDPEAPLEGDQVIDKKDVRVVVDAETASLLDGAELDCADTPAGPRLTIGRPGGD